MGDKTGAFRLEEASIEDFHAAIRAGRATCVEVVERYLERVRAYNGVASMLVTEDGAPVPEATGVVRGGSPLRFPTETVKAADVLPELDKYQGPPLEFGRMEATASDPDVQQQYGMIVGIPNAGQVNALATLNIRGERSVTCRGDFDRHPSEGPLPPGAPPMCEGLSPLPRRARARGGTGRRIRREPRPRKIADARRGVFFQGSLRHQGHALDGRRRRRLRHRFSRARPHPRRTAQEQGRHHLRQGRQHRIQRRAGDPGGRHEPEKVLPSVLGYQRSTWGGNPSNPYDTTRAASLGSSSGSALSVSTNMVMASLGEETRASCRGPSNHNAVALILPHKAMLGFDGGAIGADIYCDRSGVITKSLGDCAKVLDALKDPVNGYYDPRDPFTTVPRSSVLDTPYAAHVRTSGEAGALEGVRIGVIRESMVYPRGSKSEEPIVNAAAREIKEVLGQKLGAKLLESTDPLWAGDPEIETMKTDFRRALARLIPVFMPDIMFRLTPEGAPLFREFAEAIVPTEFAPGVVFGSGDMQPIDYMLDMGEGRIEQPKNLDLATVQQQELAMTFRYHIHQYLSRRAEDWQARGFSETITGFPELNARSKFWGDDHRAAFRNWEEVADPRNPHGGRQGVNERIMLRELLRRVDMMVILENNLDALVRLHTPFPPAIIGGAVQPGLVLNSRPESQSGPNAGLTEVLVPAGYVRTTYDPVFELSEDGTRFISVPNDQATTIPEPGLPFSLVFRAEPGREDALLRIASTYEAASKRRIPPPDFGPLSE